MNIMQVTVNIPTQIRLTDDQQHQVVKKYLIKHAFDFDADFLPYYCKKLDCFVISQEVFGQTKFFKVAEGNDKEFERTVAVLNKLMELTAQNSPMIKAELEDVTIAIGNPNGQLQKVQM